MATSTRFAVATHIMACLAVHRGRPVTSEKIASSANTSPAVVRQLLTLLARAKLTKSQLGHGGGSLLARPASEITLLDIYRATENPCLFAEPRNCPSTTCGVGKNIRSVLRPTLQRAQDALYQELDAVELETISQELVRLHRRRSPADST